MIAARNLPEYVCESVCVMVPNPPSPLNHFHCSKVPGSITLGVSLWGSRACPCGFPPKNIVVSDLVTLNCALIWMTVCVCLRLSAQYNSDQVRVNFYEKEKPNKTNVFTSSICITAVQKKRCWINQIDRFWPRIYDAWQNCRRAYNFLWLFYCEPPDIQMFQAWIGLFEMAVSIIQVIKIHRKGADFYLYRVSC